MKQLALGHLVKKSQDSEPGLQISALHHAALVYPTCSNCWIELWLEKCGCDCVAGVVKSDILKVVWNWITFNYWYSSKILGLSWILILILTFQTMADYYKTLFKTLTLYNQIVLFFGLMIEAAEFG